MFCWRDNNNKCKMAITKSFCKYFPHTLICFLNVNYPGCDLASVTKFKIAMNNQICYIFHSLFHTHTHNLQKVSTEVPFWSQHWNSYVSSPITGSGRIPMEYFKLLKDLESAPWEFAWKYRSHEVYTCKRKWYIWISMLFWLYGWSSSTFC